MNTLDTLLALGMNVVKPFIGIDMNTGKLGEIGTVLSCFRTHKLDSDNFEIEYFIVYNDGKIFDECGFEPLNINDIKEDFKYGFLFKDIE
jgi:hypothetical protein